jgi:hypothetical protein
MKRAGPKALRSITMRGDLCLPAWLALALVGCGGADPSSLLTVPEGGDEAPISSDDATDEVTVHFDAAPPADTGAPDVSPVPDAGPPDTGASGPNIYCGHAGTKDCRAVQADCCVVADGLGSATYACQDPANPSACSTGGGVPVYCESAVDCPGQVCCGTQNNLNQYISVSCLSSCSGTNDRQFCDPNAVPSECGPAFTFCGPSTLLPGYSVCQ